MTTQFKIFPCRAKGTAPVRSGRAARQPACAFRRKARAASRKTPQIASSQPRPAGAGPLSARAGRKIVNTANSPVCRTRARGERSDAAPSSHSRRQNRSGNCQITRGFKTLPCRPNGTAPVRPGRAARQFACARRRSASANRRAPAARRSGITRPAQPLEELPQITVPEPRPPGAGPLSVRAGRKIWKTAVSHLS